jgi:hypothetical protein
MHIRLFGSVFDITNERFSMNKIVACIGLISCLPLMVQAQTEPIINLVNGQRSLSAASCETELNQQLSVQVQHTDSSTENHTLKVVYFTDSKDCLSSATQCPSAFVDDVEACGCIVQHTVTGESPPIDAGTTLGSDEDLVSFLCSASGSLTISVSVQLDVEGTEPVYTESPVSIVIDIEAPEASTVAPNLGSGEESLTVSLADRADISDDVSRHEVCYAPRGSILPPSDCGVSDALTVAERSLRLYCGFSESDCKETNELLTGDYRIEGLLNEVEYEVVVAAIDEAGNRSANSPSSFGSPAEFVDFAEGYGQLFGDNATGETGGCNTHSQTPGTWLMFLFVVMGLRRVRW